MSITLTREEAQQVLDALEWAADGIDTEMTQPYEKDHDCNCPICTTIETLRTKLSEPEPEEKKYTEESCPVCGYYCLGKGGVNCIDKPKLCGINNAPPQREWQGLTDEDKKQIQMEAGNKSEMTAFEYALRVGEFTEAKLKEKNHV
jgi:hypothetical protein